MKFPFERTLHDVTRLMRGGKLADATAAIQAALGVKPAAPRGEVVDVEARVVDTPAPAPAPASTPRPHPTATFTAGHFRNARGARDYKLFEPPRDGRALPLVVMLHGCTQDPDDFARGTGMNELALAAGALVLYPAQTQTANTSRCWNWFKHNHQARDQGEPAILAGMVREVIATHDIDPARVYVAGLSAGGAMAAILGDAYPDLFAAVGVHSGLPTGAARDVTSAFSAMKSGAQPVRRSTKTGATPPTIVFHGDADTTVVVDNAERVVDAAGWRAKPGARRRLKVNERQFTQEVLEDEQGVERGEQWTLHGAGHAWSGGRAGGSYTDPRGPDASAEMLRFFLAHPKA